VVVLGISGSLRAGSFNTALLRAAAGFLPPAACMPLYTDLALLPPYSEEADDGPVPAPVERLRAGIETADALLIATPEYNASIPGQLKNALDWTSRPFPDNALRRKPVAVVGASTGLFGAVSAQAELRKVLATAGADVLDDELPVGSANEAFDDDLTLADRELRARLEHILARLLDRARLSGSSRRCGGRRLRPALEHAHGAQRDREQREADRGADRPRGDDLAGRRGEIEELPARGDGADENEPERHQRT
jgi:chromate reductase, NAD(P)H dehydrogenase (quinone)